MLHTNPEVVNPTQVPVGPSPEYFIAYQLVCGLYYYFYNELAFMVLDLLDPVGQVLACPALICMSCVYVCVSLYMYVSLSICMTCSYVCVSLYMYVLFICMCLAVYV
jgi:hypothetical protein